MVKFNRTAVSEYILSRGITCGNVTLTVTGKVDGTQFEGEDKVEVLFPGDLDHDGDVDSIDVCLFVGAYPSKPPLNPEADLDSDADIDSDDLTVLAGYYGTKGIVKG